MSYLYTKQAIFCMLCEEEREKRHQHFVYDYEQHSTTRTAPIKCEYSI